MTRGHHHAAANQRAARKRAELDRFSGIIDPPHHDGAHVGIAVVFVDGCLGRHRPRSEQQSQPTANETGHGTCQSTHERVSAKNSLRLSGISCELIDDSP